MTNKKPKNIDDRADANQVDLVGEKPIQESGRPMPNSLTDRPKKSLPLAIIIAIISLIALILIVLYMQSVDKSDTVAPIENDTVTVTTPQAAPLEVEDRASAMESESTDTDDLETDSTTEADTEDATDIDINLEKIPDPEEILSAPIPESEVLVKEEIQRLSDEEERLAEQKVLLAEQVSMMDELNAKKEEQVALLEQQIAQLEQADTAE